MALGRCAVKYEPLNEPTNEQLMALGLAMSNRIASTTTVKAPYDLPAGFTYFGQFVDHDLSYFTDEDTPFDGPGKLTQKMRPMLDLHGLYSHVSAQPDALCNTMPGALALQSLGVNDANITVWDMPRDAEGFALIGDARNDENFLLSQFHTLMLRLHNAVIAELIASGAERDPSVLMQQARACVEQVYRRIIVQDYLKRLLCDEVWHGYFGAPEQQWTHWSLYSDADFNRPNAFNLAAYRFGHAQVRGIYGVNAKRSITLDELFDYRGGRDYYQHHRHIPPELGVDWQLFFYDSVTDHPFVQVALPVRPTVPLKIPHIASPLNRLAVRNLLRSRDQELPCAQAIMQNETFQQVCQQLASPSGILHSDNLDNGYFSHISNGEMFNDTTPLWYFILREGEVMRGRAYRDQGILGPMGSILVAAFFKLTLQHTPGQADFDVRALPLQIDTISSMSEMVRYVLQQEGKQHDQ